MKSLIFNLGSQVLRNVIAGQGAEKLLSSFLGNAIGSPAAPAPAPRPDFAYLTRYAKRLFVLTAVGFVCTLFFVMGTMMAIGAVAQSMDLFNVFVAGTVFYAGTAVASVAALGLLICISKARRHRLSWDFFFRHSDVPVTIAASEIKTRANYATETYASSSAPSAAQAEAVAPTLVRPGPERIAS